MRNKVRVIGGGTVNPVANHLQVCSFARGTVAKKIHSEFVDHELRTERGLESHLYLSKMCHMDKDDVTTSIHLDAFHTNEDLKGLIEGFKDDSETKMIVLSAAVTDFYYPDGNNAAERPNTSRDYHLTLSPAEKIVAGIRDNEHKHITLVAFKNTVNKTPKQMYLAGLNLCKTASVNLVFVNDTVTRHNMIITPEEATYADGWDRNRAVKELVEIALLRSHLTFTRSTVIAGDAIGWDSELIPDSLKTIVDHCIQSNAYKVFNGATVGHFAHKINDTTFLTSIRRSNFNDLHEVGLVKVVTDGPDSVTAYGAKPSVGGQSQRMVFGNHPENDCILHFHCPLKENNPNNIPVRSQREVECGSHECGKNTSDGLKQFGNLKAVMLLNHGPNIVFNKNIDPKEVIDFIEKNFDLSEKTGGYNLEERTEGKYGFKPGVLSKIITPGSTGFIKTGNEEDKLDIHPSQR